MREGRDGGNHCLSSELFKLGEDLELTPTITDCHLPLGPSFSSESVQSLTRLERRGQTREEEVKESSYAL